MKHPKKPLRVQKISIWHRTQCQSIRNVNISYNLFSAGDWKMKRAQATIFEGSQRC
jgi:hypothetical protein